MIDDDDATAFAWLFPVIGPISAVLFVAGILYLLYQADQNDTDCRARPCEYGVPRLLDGECVCAGEPKR